MNENNIKACPFCGGDAYSLNYAEINALTVVCKECGASTAAYCYGRNKHGATKIIRVKGGYDAARSAAIDAWNRRI